MSTISKNYKIIIFPFFLIFFLRLPFFFTDVFNWDESTYIIIGQWIVDGGLPYLGRTEIKPPLLGYLYSFFVFFSFGELYLIRFFNCLLLGINLIFLFKIFLKIFNFKSYFFLTTSFIFSSTFIIRDSQSLFSEHFAVTFLTVALYFIIQRKNSLDYFKIGVLLACASLTRFNLVLIPLFLLIYFFLKDRNNFNKDKKFIFHYIFAGALVTLIVFIPYIINDGLFVALNSIFISGSAMAKNAPNSFFGAIYHLLFTKSDLLKINSFEGLFRVFFWIISFLGFILISYRSKNNNKFFELCLFFVLIFISIVIGSRASAHYLILLNPISSIFFSYFLIILYERVKQTILIYIISLVMCSFLSLNQYFKLYENYKTNKTLYNGISFEIANYISNKLNNKNDKIYIYKNNIIYWLLKKYPPTDITHPSDIFKEYLFEGWGKKNSSTAKEYSKILEVEPKFLLINDNFNEFFKRIYNENEMTKIIQKHEYELIKKYKQNYLYIRK